ncbi:hypothetical protein [Filimonas effusa]|uniref:Uncharacterized protein n=1 Tax=Filimonas effusa TaxID=2508721 RepID=A0A4Q1D9F0_9BACT|nr:hypothetical protein [Filimonas effusa]RXK85325.1 hypothetical protein ESB13_00420 [Filimonas effusa]
MSVVKFEEVLNDLVDYFLLGDPYLLMDFKNRHQLPDDLISEFTTSTAGDQVVEDGVMIPMARIENYPYTIYFNMSSAIPELLKETSRLQIKQEGYRMQVISGEVYLYTIPYIRNFTPATLVTLTSSRITKISLPNGWYKVDILGGETLQHTGLEPTFEFLITPVANKPGFSANIMYQFTITASEY